MDGEDVLTVFVIIVPIVLLFGLIWNLSVSDSSAKRVKAEFMRK